MLDIESAKVVESDINYRVVASNLLSVNNVRLMKGLEALKDASGVELGICDLEALLRSQELV